MRTKAKGFFLLFIALFCKLPTHGQTTPKKSKPHAAPASVKRLVFAEAQQLLVGENEGNVNKRVTLDVTTYTLTRLRSGQMLELYYPVAPNQPAANGKKRSATVPGYGVLYESEDAYLEVTRPRHALEDLIPDGRAFVAAVPQLIARLEKRLRLDAGKLDYTRASLRRLDALVAARQNTQAVVETNAQLFQELTAYYGETLRRALNAEWQITDERIGKTRSQSEPNLRVPGGGFARARLVKPWDSVFNAFFDEAKRAQAITKAFDADLAAMR